MTTAEMQIEHTIITAKAALLLVQELITQMERIKAAHRADIVAAQADAHHQGRQAGLSQRI